ncbi:MAG: hypothetical protein ILA15_10290 [Clostridiales bacterium]|nr:hypothetical protein [Clostridiales bacterium]
MKKNREDKKKIIRTPDFEINAEGVQEFSEDAQLGLSGEDTATLEDKITSESPAPMKEEVKKNDIAPVKLDLAPAKADKESRTPVTKGSIKSITFLVIASIVVLATVAASLFYNAGIKEKLQSPLTIGGTPVDSAEFSFMYHYILIDNGVDIFAAETPEMLASPSVDTNYATNRDYFLDLTAQQMQLTQLLYDDAISHGYEIEQKHYDLARAYIDWLQGKADELGVDLTTYIRGVFGDQVDEQVILSALAKMYFTEDYSSNAKLVELQATEEQAEEAYQNNPNAYDEVDYKLLRIRYEQRDQAFIDTANLHANQIIEQMGQDPSMFEAIAAQYFSGEAAAILQLTDSCLTSGARYDDFTHTDFRDWLFDSARTPGDAVIFNDGDGFPIILVFVNRERQTVPLRDVRMVEVLINNSGDETIPGYDIANAQQVAQEIYDTIGVFGEETDVQTIENLYNDDIINGNIVITHSQDTYPGKYEGILDEWIFSDTRVAGDKAFLETDTGYYIVYLVDISTNPEWYDRVNSFVRMRNYQAFLNETISAYQYEFNQTGLDRIADVP